MQRQILYTYDRLTETIKIIDKTILCLATIYTYIHTYIYIYVWFILALISHRIVIDTRQRLSTRGTRTVHGSSDTFNYKSVSGRSAVVVSQEMERERLSIGSIVGAHHVSFNRH